MENWEYMKNWGLHGKLKSTWKTVEYMENNWEYMENTALKKESIVLENYKSKCRKSKSKN